MYKVLIVTGALLAVASSSASAAQCLLGSKYYPEGSKRNERCTAYAPDHSCRLTEFDRCNPSGQWTHIRASRSGR